MATLRCRIWSVAEIDGPHAAVAQLLLQEEPLVERRTDVDHRGAPIAVEPDRLRRQQHAGGYSTRYGPFCPSILLARLMLRYGADTAQRAGPLDRARRLTGSSIPSIPATSRAVGSAGGREHGQPTTRDAVGKVSSPFCSFTRLWQGSTALRRPRRKARSVKATEAGRRAGPGRGQGQASANAGKAKAQPPAKAAEPGASPARPTSNRSARPWRSAGNAGPGSPRPRDSTRPGPSARSSPGRCRRP